MGIEATSTSTMSVAGASSNSGTSATSSKTNSDASFKDEMTKVSNTEEKKESKEVSEKKSDAAKSNESKDKGKVSETLKSDTKKTEKTQDNTAINAQINFNNQFSLNDANMMLTNDIAQMIENSANVSSLNDKSWTIGFGSDSKTNISMNENDAQFFLNLTTDGDVSMQNIVAQGQGMLNSGADINEVAQNVRVSQTLLNALNEARQNNQPIRIDFDQNISVILRVGRDGAISANFIPSDKVAEQYLRNNINELRNAFDEQELPYTELSYSNSSKEQNKKRRQQAQQGE